MYESVPGRGSAPLSILIVASNAASPSLVALLEAARRAAACSVNVLMTATYWEIGRRIVEFDQGEQDRAGYGQALIKRLSADLSRRFGRSFSERNLEQMRLFYQAWPVNHISQTPSAELPGVRFSRTSPAISAGNDISPVRQRRIPVIQFQEWSFPHSNRYAEDSGPR